MPSVNIQILALGPVLDVHLGVSVFRRMALEGAGVPVPPSQSCRLLVDTGASCTCADPWVIKALGLSPSGTVNIQTPSTDADNPHVCNQYDVSLLIPHPSINRVFNATPIIESAFSHQGIDGLLGRDILSHCLFVYNGELGLYTLSF